MDQLRSLRTFVRVVDEGSFAGAARALDLAPAVITRQMADLEDQLGTRLLHRTTRKLTLTPVGLQYLERARQILRDLDEANALAADTTGTVAGTLRIAGPPPLLARQVMPLLPGFLARHPQVDFHCLPLTMPETPVDEADLTLLLRGPEPLDGSFVVRQLARSEIVLCATPSYLDRHGRPTRPKELEAHDMLVPSFAQAQREWKLVRRLGVGRIEEATGIARLAAVTTANPDLLLAAARVGMGVVGTLSFLVADALERGELECVLPEWRVGQYTIYGAMPTRKFLPLRARLFLDYLAETWGDSEQDPWLTKSMCAKARPA